MRANAGPNIHRCQEQSFVLQQTHATLPQVLGTQGSPGGFGKSDSARRRLHHPKKQNRRRASCSVTVSRRPALFEREHSFRYDWISRFGHRSLRSGSFRICRRLGHPRNNRPAAMTGGLYCAPKATGKADAAGASPRQYDFANKINPPSRQPRPNSDYKLGSQKNLSHRHSSTDTVRFRGRKIAPPRANVNRTAHAL